MMDGWTAFASITGSLGLAVGGAYWLVQRLISHRLKLAQQGYQADIDRRLSESRSQLERELRDHQAQLDEKLARQKSEVEARLRREVDEYLGDRAADREYQLDARKRLYTAVGLLRFQLVIAANDIVGRIAGIGSRHYQLKLAGYYGRSTLYRFLRLLAIIELINRQMAYTDFSVDRSVVMLLRFRRRVFQSLSDQMVENDPTNWDRQEQHLFNDTVLLLSTAGIVSEPGNIHRVIRYDEFTDQFTTEGFLHRLRPLPIMLDDFSPEARSLLWLRLVALAAVCSSFVDVEAPKIGLEPNRIDISSLVARADPSQISSRYRDYETSIRTLATDLESR